LTAQSEYRFDQKSPDLPEHEMHHLHPAPTLTLILRAALAYFGIVFACAFSLGIARTLLLAPLVGDLAAVLLEVPLVLTISWIAAGLVLRHWRLNDATTGPRLGVGALAFVFLMLAEILLASALGQDGATWAASLFTPSGMVGFAGQVAFALIPLAHPR
jgi:hypothetical protein